MLFENLRNVKKKWKVPALIVIIVLILGLLSSFAYLGSSFGSGENTAATGTSIESLESQAKEAAKAADDSDDGETVIAHQKHIMILPYTNSFTTKELTPKKAIS